MLSNLAGQLKNPIVWLIGGGVLLVLILARSRSSGSSGGSAPADDGGYYAAQAANQGAALQMAQIEAGTEQSRIAAGVDTLRATLDNALSLAGVSAQRDIATQKIGADERSYALGTAATQALGMSKIDADRATQTQKIEADYQSQKDYLETSRILGLTKEETERYRIQRENDTTLTAIDTGRFLTERTLQSEETRQINELGYKREELGSNERITNAAQLRALDYARITGDYTVKAIKAGKPSAWGGFLSGLGKGVGGGLGALLGGL
jgi:hypothetical protein